MRHPVVFQVHRAQLVFFCKKSAVHEPGVPRLFRGLKSRLLLEGALRLVWFSGSLYCLQSQRPRNRRSFDCARYTCSAQDDIGGGVEGYGISFRKLLPQSSLRSIHVGFSPSISASFFERFQPFSCFSRAIALLGECGVQTIPIDCSCTTLRSPKSFLLYALLHAVPNHWSFPCRARGCGWRPCRYKRRPRAFDCRLVYAGACR